MGLGVLVLGKSGTGKSCSLRNFGADDVSIINVNGKPFPFKNNFDKVFATDKANVIKAGLTKASTKTIIIDDSQYIMANEYMRRSNEKGFGKYEEIGRNFWDLVMSVRDLPEDVIVYFLHHEEIDEFGGVSAKTQGKMIDNHICLEGMFSIVLRSRCQDGHYYFQTHNGGNDTVKTPMGMFEADLIENDLKLVDSQIREYYGFNIKEKATKGE